MLKINYLIINGSSTQGLPFYVEVEELSAPNKSKKKNKFFETQHANGLIVQEIDAYEPIEKPYKLYLHGVDEKGLRQFKSFITDRGTFTPSNENDLTYYFEDVEMEIKPIDAVGGYEVEVNFICQPFGFEKEITEPLGNTIVNHTNAPMYPRIKITGLSANQTYLKIGNQTMYFKEIQDVIYLECKHGFQDAWSSGGRKVNHEVKGDFFEIQPGTHSVTIGPGISSVEITKRWGWR